MKLGLTLVLANIATIILATIAGYMAVYQLDGWGWFLFAAVILSHSYGRD